MKLHVLKIEDKFYEAVLDDKKRFEVRFNDRDYQVNDLIHFVNVNGEEFSKGNEYYESAVWRIEYILKAEDFPDGLQKGYVVLALTRLTGHDK